MTDTSASNPREFNTTHWSLVGAAQSDAVSRSRARNALEELCRAYWYPLYAFVRQRGHSSFDAQDLTQAFLVQFIESGGFSSAQRDRGRFRTYMLGALKHFLANEWHRARRKKRGGDVKFLEWDALDPEARYGLEPHHPDDADAGFDREWALELTARAKRLLRTEMEAAGKVRQFEALETCLAGEMPDRAKTARQAGLSEGALKVAIHRFRRRYRELLRLQIADTVDRPADVDAELRHLVAALRQR